ncbi:MAG: hypothetical protein ACO1PN_10345 [Betaproteobacteria bacterium]
MNRNRKEIIVKLNKLPFVAMLVALPAVFAEGVPGATNSNDDAKPT